MKVWRTSKESTCVYVTCPCGLARWSRSHCSNKGSSNSARSVMVSFGKRCKLAEMLLSPQMSTRWSTFFYLQIACCSCIWPEPHRTIQSATAQFNVDVLAEPPRLPTGHSTFVLSLGNSKNHSMFKLPRSSSSNQNLQLANLHVLINQVKNNDILQALLHRELDVSGFKTQLAPQAALVCQNVPDLLVGQTKCSVITFLGASKTALNVNSRLLVRLCSAPA